MSREHAALAPIGAAPIGAARLSRALGGVTTRLTAVFLAFALFGGAACASRTGTSASGSPATPGTRPNADSVAPGSPVPGGGRAPWISRLLVDHPLVGRIYAAKDRGPIDEATLVARLVSSRFVLLGEQHDNPDHHRLQAVLLEKLVQAGRSPTVAFEMFETGEQPLIDAYRTTAGATADGLGPALHFEHSGWPPWSFYAPIARVAFAASLSIVAADPPRAAIHALVHGGTAAQHDDLARLGIAEPLSPPLFESLRRELAESHCGQLPAEMVDAMVTAQRARDASMARALVDGARRAGGANGAVLIAGTGHARSDRGVPLYLRELDPRGSVATLAFVEVDAHVVDPNAYAARFHADELPFDFVWFTPAISDDDPCAKFSSK